MAGVWLFLAGSVTACAPPWSARIALDSGVRAQLPSAPAIHVVVYPANPPSLVTAKALAVGLLLVRAADKIVSARTDDFGRELMVRHNVEDLSTQLANTFVEQLKATLPNLERAIPASSGRQDVNYRKETDLRPFVLDFRSYGIIGPYRWNFVRYNLVYSARVRLVDVEQGRVLWQSGCYFTGAEDPTQRPTLDELEAADGIAYRRLITEAISACATDLLNQFPREGGSGGLLPAAFGFALVPDESELRLLHRWLEC